MAEKSRRGFAAMDDEKKRAIASKGGKAAHQKGTAHRFTTEEARAAGGKGVAAGSRNGGHRAAIGRKGGASVSRDREHMAAIGREGGQSGQGNRAPETAPEHGNGVSTNMTEQPNAPQP